VSRIFVARNAGNMVDTATMGTIEYGAEHFGIPLFVVMGHSRCGAVTAACAVVVRESAKRTAQKIATESEFVASLIKPRKSRCWRRAMILTAVSGVRYVSHYEC
jgi:carbonic anhydrase